MQPEIYRTIKDYSDYEVSNYGNVRSWKTTKGKSLSPRILKNTLNSDGRHDRLLMKNGVGKHKLVHRLVLETFGPPMPTPKHQCCHNDGNKLNNHIDNLRWGTVKENMADKIIHGTNNQGEKHLCAKLKESDIPIIRLLAKSGKMQSKIASLYNVNQGTIFDIVKRKTWKHV